MPAQKAVSGIFAKYGQRLTKAFDAHKTDQTEYSQFGDLPPNIENGIAQLVDCKFVQIQKGKTNEGEWMFYAAGVVKAPKVQDGIPIEGLRTQISEPLFDTPTRGRKTLTDHVAHILNELRKLGADTANLSVNDLETTVNALKEAAPHFRFRTWKGDPTPEYPNPRVNHTWNGLVEYTGDDDPGGAVEDHTTPSRNGAAAAAEDTADEEPTAEAGDYQLLELAQAADEGDEDARKQLTELAVAAGASEEDVENAPDWSTVARMASGEAAEGGDEEAVEEEPAADEPEPDWEPQKEEVYKYQLLDKSGKPLTDPKTKKAKKPVEVEIVSVDKKAKTVVIKNLDDGKTLYKGVKWDLLIQA
jgi:hypothetical protein